MIHMISRLPVASMQHGKFVLPLFPCKHILPVSRRDYISRGFVNSYDTMVGEANKGDDEKRRMND